MNQTSVHPDTMNHDNLKRKRINLKSMPLPAMNTVIAISTVLVILGGIGLAGSLGWWRTSGAGRVPAVINQGNFTGVYDPADIRGSTSFGTLETYFRIPAALLAQAFGIQAEDPRLVTAKFVDTIYGEVPGLAGGLIDVGTDAVRLFVARMTGLPYTPEEATGLPQSAIDLILNYGAGMSDEELQNLTSKATISRVQSFDGNESENPGIPAPESASGSGTASTFEPGSVLGTPNASGSAAGGAGGFIVSGTGFVFQGKTSFADVMAAGLSQAQIESVLGMPMGPKLQSVKDFCLNKGLQFSAVRAGLSQLMEL